MTNRFTYAQKYVIAGIIRGVGFFIFWFSLLFLILNQVSLIKAQLNNSRLQAPLRDLYESLIIADKKAANKLINSLNFADIPKVQTQDTSNRVTLESINQKWETIEEGVKENSIIENPLYPSLLRDVRLLMEQQSDAVLLSMDPTNVSYLLLEDVKRRLRDSQSLIWQAVSLTEGKGGSNQLDPEDRERLQVIAQYLQRTSESVFQDINKIRIPLSHSLGNEELIRKLRITVNQYRVAVEEFIISIQQGLLVSDNPENTAELDLDGTLVLGTSITLRELITEQLDLILEQRKYDLWTRMLIVFVLGIFFTFIGSYLGVHFVYEAIKAFHALDLGTRKLTSGDFSVRVPVVYTEEIGKATMTFNRMADHLEKLINQQRSLFEATRQLAEGNFSVRVQVDESMDEEMIEVSTSFNNMAQTFEEIVRQLHRLGVNLASSANEIATASIKQQELILEQGEATREISITASEISTTAKDFAITINDVSHVAEQSSNLASDGQDSLIAMEKIMRQMVSASSSIAKKLEILNEKASNITKIITTITNVARQTNLLSLNAAIEAEKTGKFSRDFSVIAREIRRLADQTALATFDIENIVNEIMNAVSSCVTGVEDFTKQIQFGVDQVGLVGEQLGQIIVQVQALAYRFESVNEGMQSQSGSAEKINESMVQLSHAATTTSESITRFSETIDHLSTASHDLRKTIENISISDQRHPSLSKKP